MTNDRTQHLACPESITDHFFDMKGRDCIGSLGDERVICAALTDKHHRTRTDVIVAEHKIHKLIHTLLLEQISRYYNDLEMVPDDRPFVANREFTEDLKHGITRPRYIDIRSGLLAPCFSVVPVDLTGTICIVTVTKFFLE